MRLLLFAIAALSVACSDPPHPPPATPTPAQSMADVFPLETLIDEERHKLYFERFEELEAAMVDLSEQVALLRSQPGSPIGHTHPHEHPSSILPATPTRLPVPTTVAVSTATPIPRTSTPIPPVVTATSPLTVPSEPTVTYARVHGKEIHIQWDAPASDGGSPILTYHTSYRTSEGEG